MACEARHPEYGEPCILNGNHQSHLCRVDTLAVPVQWPNDAYVPPTKKKRWEPKPPRKFSFGELKDAQAEANHHASQETARLEQTLFRPSEELRADHAFENGTEMSHLSADDVRPISGPVRIRVLRAIAGFGERGASDEMIEQFLVMKHQSVSARRRELALSGFVEVVGKAVNSSGSQAQLWAITELGREALKEAQDG
jgi:hypothetical protein